MKRIHNIRHINSSRSLLSKRRECGFAEQISAKRQMSADGAADLRRRAAPSARTTLGGEAIDSAEEIRLQAKPAPRGYRGALVACLWISLVLGTARNAVAQTGLNPPARTQTDSTKEQLARALEALRANNSLPATNAPPVKQKELFLDLTAEPSTAATESESSQAMAATLNVSMASSPMQVVMRAVAWISIVLCVCCLVILAARRWQRARGLLPTTTSRSRVLETLSLGPSRTVSLIEMHGYRALVATDAGGIRSLVLAPSTFEESLREEEGMGNDQ